VIATLAAALVLAVSPGHAATVRVSVANVWQAPNSGRLPLVTQALYGERVLVVGSRPGWSRIVVPDQPSPLDRRGYPGWVRASQLAPAFPAPRVVTVRRARLANGTSVGLGSQVPGGALPARDTRPLPRTRADLVRTAKQFVGLHYLWGGLSAWGYDCSGLTWAVYRAHGITIPRDADAQFAAGRPVPLSKILPGDLLFYEHPVVGHVAMSVGRGLMIESPNSRGDVRVVPVRTSDFRGVRRFF
jgi:cell wall-associated NlpC family hydrolase